MRLACLYVPSFSLVAPQPLFDLASRFSPRVDEGDPGSFFLDLRGEKNESAFGELLLQKALQNSPVAKVGIAGGKLAARLAAEVAHGVYLVPPGEDHLFLAPLPLRHLPLSDDLQEKLGQWGIRTIGQFATLPAAGLLNRLGKEVADLHAE